MYYLAKEMLIDDRCFPVWCNTRFLGAVLLHLANPGVV